MKVFTIFDSEDFDGIVFIAVINELSEKRVIEKVVFCWGKAFLVEVRLLFYFSAFLTLSNFQCKLHSRYAD